jgi:hypothetical protein
MTGPVEPSADIRLMAKHMRQNYLALIAEGFTSAEALQIIGLLLAAFVAGGGTS